MPRGSFLRRTPEPSRSRGAFTIKNPSRHLQTHSQSGASEVADFQPPSPKGHEWQKDAFAFNVLVPEIGFLNDMTSKLVAACDLTVMVEDPETDALAEAHDPRARRVMKAFIGPVGGQKELKRRAALHLQIAGESLLFGTPLKDEHGFDVGMSWEFLSPREVKAEQKRSGTEMVTAYTRNSSGVDDGDVPADAHVSRLYRPDAEFSGRADSPLRRVLPICRELLVLSEVVDGAAKSRLPAGILFVPEEFSFGADDETIEEGDISPDDIDKFIEDLIEHMRAPIEDRTSAAGLVPLVVKGPAEFGEKMRLIPLSVSLDEAFQGLRAELLQRIARGLDAPPEIIQGKASLNHWSAYSVDNDFVDRHVAPLGQMLAEFLTIAYLRPMMIKWEGVDPADADRFSLAFDPRPLAQMPDEGAAATTGWDRLVTSDESWLASNGMTAADMPSPDERRRRLLEKLVQSAPVSMGPMLLPILYPELADAITVALADAAAAKVVVPVAGADVPVAGPVVQPNNNPGGPPESQPTEPPSSTEPSQASLDALVERLATAADAALDRALERAASRVITRTAKHPILRNAFKSVPKREVLGRMTDLDFRSLKVTRQELLADTWDGFADRASEWVTAWAVGEGCSSDTAREVADVLVRTLCRDLDDVVGSSVGQPSVGPNGLMIPSAVVRSAMDRSLQQSGPPASWT